MRKQMIDKDFDDREVQDLGGPSIEQMWSQEAFALYGPPRDTPADIGEWLQAQSIEPVLDIGCGSGALKQGYHGRWVGLDRSIEQLRQTDGTRVLGDALHLPFVEESFAGVVASYILYFFEEPELVAHQALRVLRPGGCFATCAPSRFDCPELAHVVPSEGDVFMAEDIPDLLFAHFREVELNVWDFPAFDMLDRDTVRDYLYSHYYPQLTRAEAAERAERVEVPLKVTKRGIWGVGRKPR